MDLGDFEVPELDSMDSGVPEDDFLDDFEEFFVLDDNPKKLLGIEDFEAFLTKRKFEPEQVYGTHSSQKAVTMCRFSNSKDGETILADIERKNTEQGMGNIAIPNTNIKLINYSICPKCKTVFLFKDLMDYYRNPKPDQEYRNKGHQIREDTRVCCSECGEYFIPALVIADGTPKNEVQFLCRMQTVNAIETYFLDKGQQVLSQNKGNVFKNGKIITIRNDVELKQLESKPTLISNMLQYTQMNLLPNLLDGTNVEKGDMLFGKWNLILY